MALLCFEHFLMSTAVVWFGAHSTCGSFWFLWQPIRRESKPSFAKRGCWVKSVVFYVVRDVPQPWCSRLHRKYLDLWAFILIYSNKCWKSHFNIVAADNKLYNDRDLTAASLGKWMDITHNAPCPSHLSLATTLITHSIQCFPFDIGR